MSGRLHAQSRTDSGIVSDKAIYRPACGQNFGQVTSRRQSGGRVPPLVGSRNGAIPVGSVYPLQPGDSLTILNDGFVGRLHQLRFLH